MAVPDSTLLVVATAIATTAEWTTPFDVRPAGAMRERWGVEKVLRSPTDDHAVSLADTLSLGSVAVHTVDAAGLRIWSVIADAAAEPHEVLTVALDLVASRQAPPSLFTSELGEGHCWTLTEERVRTAAPFGREEQSEATLPAWSADGQHDLTVCGLGFDLLGLPLSTLFTKPALVAARQSATATFQTNGFRAAAVSQATAWMGYDDRGPERRGHLRRLTVRFDHPYAVVAETTGHGAWDGLPVFQAWVAEAVEAE